ncbi:MAG: transcription elongation factor GreA [Mycoplasmataceae bacterium]|nr:transcription elongation factor GreA [Mycoplasmataceae bacterium]
MLSQKTLLTREKINELKSELKRLISKDRVEVIQEIKDARNQGDLSENAEFDSAREKQGVIEDRIRELEDLLENSDILKKQSSNSLVSIGTTVEIKIGKSETTENFTIVTTYETDPFENKISNQSPLAIALMGSSKGDTVTVEAPKKYDVTVVNILI